MKNLIYFYIFDVNMFFFYFIYFSNNNYNKDVDLFEN
jgi:hypothetical protein